MARIKLAECSETLPLTSIDPPRRAKEVGVLNEGMILILEISCFPVPPHSAPRRYKSGNTVGMNNEYLWKIKMLKNQKFLNFKVWGIR
jgi:hypothetical protein